MAIFSRFSVCISCLEMLNPLEQGIVSYVKNNDPSLLKQLREMGIEIGQAITVEKCFPAFQIAMGETRLTIQREIARSIYVKLTVI